MTHDYDQILNLVSRLTYPDLKRLEIVINELVTTGYLPAQGHVEYRFITRSGKPYGPYKYRRVWQNGKLKNSYEGKASAEEYQTWLTQKSKQGRQR
jgi:hypothetical protein